MSDIPLHEVMQAYADDAVKYAKNKFGIVLDYSEQSLVNVDALLSAMTSQGLLTKDELSAEQQDGIWTLCNVFGGYVGAVIIKHIGGQWEADTRLDGSTNLKLKVANRIAASPPEKVWKRLTESEEDMIIGYYRCLQHILGLTPFEPKDLKKAWWKVW